MNPEINSINHDLNVEKVFNRHHKLYIFTVVLILLVGLVIRFYDLTDAPLDFHPTRQLYSALKARGMFYENLDSATEWQREFAVKQWKLQGLIEPPVMERLTAGLYTLSGQEVLWIPRVLSILFWSIGGLALLSLTRLMIDKNAAIFAFLLFMITPYTAIASRAFQPDPLMVTLMIFAIWGLVRWIEKENLQNAIIAGIFAGLAIFIKSIVIFPIAFAFITVVIWKKRSLKLILKNSNIWVMGSLALLPYIIYMIYGLVIKGGMQSQFSLRFFPQLWIDPVFWLRWNEMISKVVGFEFFLASILGIFLLRKPIFRVMVSALFVGYFIYGLTLSYHISTHDYYQLPLVPLVILGVAAVFSKIVSSLRGPKTLITIVVLGVIVFYTAINAWEVRVSLKRVDYRGEVAFWEKMKGVFSTDDSIIGITQDYGYRLNYWGWTEIENWMATYDFSVRELAGQEFDMQELFEEKIQRRDYFLVTQLTELDNQPEIKRLLFEGFKIHQETPDYVIFDLNQKIEN